MGRQTKLDKATEEEEVRVEKASAEVAEEEGKMVEMEKELADVQRQITAHKADDIRRERRRREEVKTARVEDVDSDMDVGEGGGDADSVGEVGVSVEEGKRRKVVKKSKFCMGTALVNYLDVDG